MSGPKTSHYTLTPEQRRILEEQRKIRIECELLVRQQQDAKSIVVQADCLIGKMESLYAETGTDTSALLQAKTQRSATMDAINLASKMEDSDGLTLLREANKKLREATRKLVPIVGALSKEHASAEKAFRSEMADRIDNGFDFTFDTIGDSANISSNPFTKKIQSEVESITPLIITDDQRARFEAIKAKFGEIDDPDFLKNFYAMTVSPFVKECRSYHNAYIAHGEEYERKRFIYESNAQKLGLVAEAIPFSTDAMAILDAKIRETEAAIQFAEEQAYIRRCVDEAMQEMGYSVLGSREIIRRNRKRFRNELYLFEEGTAVNVTYSSDGQITMELGGIATADRLPSDAESASLVSDMRTFCDDYYEIERRLRKKGIVTKRISVLPPDAQYAQIINVSDYNLCTEVSDYDAKGEKKRTTKVKTQWIGE